MDLRNTLKAGAHLVRDGPISLCTTFQGQTTVIKNVNQSPEVLDFILVENDHF